MSRRKSWTDEQFVVAVKESYSVREVLKRLGLNCDAGSNHGTVRDSIRRLGLDSSHFTGQGHLKGKRHGWSKKLDLSVICIPDSAYTCRYTLKKRLIEAGLLKPECYECGITEWLGQKLTLQLDHINGRNRDHQAENLRLLCPNCHSLTPTYCGKNNKRLNGAGDRI